MAFNSEYLPVELNGVSYAVDTSNYRRTTIPVARQQRDNSREPGENTLDTTGAWVRSQTDWSYGAGQLYIDNEDSDRRRFYSSDGIDIWTKGQITLLPITEDAASSQTFGTENLIVKRFINSTSGAEYIYVASDGEVFYSADNGANWSTFSVTNNITSLTSDGTSVYIGRDTTNTPQKALIATTSASAYGTETPDLLAVVAGRMIGAQNNSIYELDAAGAKASSSLDYSLPFSSSTWVSITAAANGIYAAANTDNTGSIYYVGVNNADGTLRTPTIAGSLPRNETINEIVSYAGLLGIGTSKGFRLGLINQQSSGITIGPCIDTGGEAFALEADGQYMWWGCDNAQTYRANLALFTDTLVPAYAADLKMAGTIVASDKVVGLARLSNSKLFLGVNKTSGASKLFRESLTGEKLTTGSLIAGECTWSTVVPKLLRSGTIDLDRSQYERAKTAYRTTTGYTASTPYTLGAPTTDAAGKIRLKAVNSSNTAVYIPSSTGSLDTGEPQTFTFPSDELTAISYDLTVEIDRSSTNSAVSPICHDWQLTAVAVPKRIDEIVLPIVLRQEIKTARGSGKNQRLDAKETFDSLRADMDSGLSMIYKEGDRTDTVTIERLEMQSERLSDDGGWWEGTLLVRLLTVPS
mgnify:FL=1